MTEHVTATLLDGMHFQVTIDQFTIDIDAAADAGGTEHPKVYTDIEIVYRVQGHNIDPEAVQRAIQLSEEKYCPVMGMLRASVNLHSRYEVVEG